MRFKEFLKEDKTFSYAQLKKDCAYFLKCRGASKKLFYRGDDSCDDDFSINAHAVRDFPRDTPRIVHDAVNNFFKEKFNWAARTDGLFVSSKEKTASTYGVLTTIFPIGHFEWLCNTNPEYRDIFQLAVKIEGNLAMGELIPDGMERADFRRLATKERYEVLAKELVKVLEASDTWEHNTNLDKCLASGSEIIIKADKYYQLNTQNDNDDSAYLQTVLGMKADGLL